MFKLLILHVEKHALTCIKQSVNYIFFTFSGDDKRSPGRIFFLDFVSKPSLCWSLLLIVNRLYPWLCHCGILKHFEIIIIDQSILLTDVLRPGFILMNVWAFQVAIFPHENEDSP